MIDVNHVNCLCISNKNVHFIEMNTIKCSVVSSAIVDEIIRNAKIILSALNIHPINYLYKPITFSVLSNKLSVSTNHILCIIQ